ncbi:hypothetical protein GALL_533550 [mine drainage metagenome]|uniref:SsuA/THI5-like domain-containing protein n=1 Tax=mine drainage metagenome TaxID=410659 RepID=A0A1J5P0M1_9ZZZZ
MPPSLFTRLLAVMASLFFLASPLRAETIRISFPPDPNALPVFVLQAKGAQFLPHDTLEFRANPAGDPSAMRALIASGQVDYALFNLIGGTRINQGGMKNFCLVSPWVWRGVYLLTPLDPQGKPQPAFALGGKTIAVSPGISTPPHIVIQKALERGGVRADYIAAGAGTVLMQLLRTPGKAPAGVAAAEPMVSQILLRQEQEIWPVRWGIALDPTEALGGAVPLGALWRVGTSIPVAARERFEAALSKAAEWSTDPANRAEAAQIAAKGYAEFFRQPIPAQAFDDMLKNRRVQWRLDTPNAALPVVQTYQKNVFGINVQPALFCAQ